MNLIAEPGKPFSVYANKVCDFVLSGFRAHLRVQSSFAHSAICFFRRKEKERGRGEKGERAHGSHDYCNRSSRNVHISSHEHFVRRCRELSGLPKYS